MGDDEAPTEHLYAARAARYEAYMEEIKHAPVCSVIGVVDPSGVVGAASPGDEFWTLRFWLENWKEEAGQLRTDKLCVEKQVSKEELDEVRHSIEPYDIIQIRARLAEPPTPIRAHALLTKIIGKTRSDAELNRVVQKLKEPITFHDSLLGTSLLDKRYDSFEAQVTWRSNETRLRLSVNEDHNPDRCVEIARSLWSQQEGWDRRIRDCAVSKLLNLRNDTWRQSDEEILTPDQFKALMSLSSITVTDSGDFEFWFNDGDLFWGHDIMVEGNLKDGPTDAGIHG